MRVVGYVRVEMCEWSGHNMRVNMECASGVMCEGLVMCESKCASGPVIVCQ